ncbi:sigma factor [Streptomyces scabichelini]|uniref:sigma factor n=1 Tax=Streptomyces scabichelini TaxID=2711217 RepID=UPI0030B9B17D
MTAPSYEAAESHDRLARVVREHAGRLAASLIQVTGDFSTAEDLVQDAVLVALKHWPVDGIPERPDAWLFTVARRRGLDLLRRQENYRHKLAQLQWPPDQGEVSEPDGRLRLVFTCCHPALAQEAQIALTLRVVCGLTTAQIARAFLVRESTVARGAPPARAKPRVGEHHPRQAEDHQGGDPVPRSRLRGAGQPPVPGPRGDLPAVQRGLPVHRRAGAVA